MAETPLVWLFEFRDEGGSKAVKRKRMIVRNDKEGEERNEGNMKERTKTRNKNRAHKKPE